MGITNGEKIKELFPDTKIITQYDNPFGDRFMVFTLNNEDMQVNIDWWNAEYKEPTTNNETKYCDRNICLKNEYNNVGCEDCEVTKSQEPTTRNCFGCKYAKDNHNAGTEECHLCMWENQYTPITKNDIPDCQCTDAEIAKSFLEDVEAVKDQLPTTKNDLEVDCISRAQVQTEIEMNAYRYTLAKERGGAGMVEWHSHLIDIDDAVDIIRNLPSVTPIRPKGHWISHREHCENLGVMPSGLGAYEWCSNCDCGIDVREWHRNHYNYCPNCGCAMVEPQESENT